MISIKRKILRVLIIIFILGLALYIFYPRKVRTVIGGNSHSNPYNTCSIVITRYNGNETSITDDININDQKKVGQIYDFISNYRVRRTLDILDSGYRGEGDFYYINFWSKGTSNKSTKSVIIYNNKYISLESWTGKHKVYRFASEEMDLKKLEELIK